MCSSLVLSKPAVTRTWPIGSSVFSIPVEILLLMIKESNDYIDMHITVLIITIVESIRVIAGGEGLEISQA